MKNTENNDYSKLPPPSACSRAYHIGETKTGWKTSSIAQNVGRIWQGVAIPNNALPLRANCRNCGAAPTKSTTLNCEYCGTY